MRSEADYAAELSHVRRDLVRIAVIGVAMFAIIFISPYIF
jgi:hypothetical protein